MTDVATRLRAIEARIAAACARVGREPASVRLLPVTKTHPSAVVRQALAAGYTRFGENKVQEARAKAAELADLPQVTWALIGHLQSNKARYLPDFAAEFQALDSIELARELDRRFAAAGRRLDVLVEVNSSGEESKFGVPPSEVPALVSELGACDALAVRGLMTLAANTPDPDAVRACFIRMTDLQARLRDEHGGGFDELSMGMSGDFELAIEQGSTCVRIGTAIFGVRPPVSPS